LLATGVKRLTKNVEDHAAVVFQTTNDAKKTAVSNLLARQWQNLQLDVKLSADVILPSVLLVQKVRCAAGTAPKFTAVVT